MSRSAAPVEGDKGGAVLRVNIQERSSTCPLSDRIWRWKEDMRNPSNCAALVAFFFQFAREVDKGEVARVVFQKTEAGQAARPSSSWTPYGGGGMGTGSINNKIRGAGRRKSAVRGGRDASIQMFAVKNEHAFVALFVDHHFDGERAERLVRDIDGRFCERYGARLREMGAQFEEAAKNPEKANLDHSFMPEFEDFAGTLEALVGDSGGDE